MMTREEHKRFVEKDSARKRAMEMALVRKDIWPSRAEAHEWFARRAPWKRWDARALQLYVVCLIPIYLSEQSLSRAYGGLAGACVV